LSKPSAQETSLDSGGVVVAVWMQPAAASHESSVQKFESSQLTGATSQAPLESQNPARHLSATAQSRGWFVHDPATQPSTVQAAPSSQSALVLQQPAIGEP
jgi:hypothetical protein